MAQCTQHAAEPDPRPPGCTCARTAGDGSDEYNDPECPEHGAPLPELQVRHLDGSTQPLMEWMGKTDLPPRRPALGMRTDVPSMAPEPPLPLLDDFDPATGHRRPGTPGYAACFNHGCRCAAELYQVANVWRRSYEAKPASMRLDDVASPYTLLQVAVAEWGLVRTLVELLRRHAAGNAVQVLHQAADAFRRLEAQPDDQRTYAERVAERLGKQP